MHLKIQYKRNKEAIKSKCPAKNNTVVERLASAESDDCLTAANERPYGCVMPKTYNTNQEKEQLNKN